MKSTNFAILVNSSDGFQDCWDPFFSLFVKYWDGPFPTIFLNTEHLDYYNTAIDVIATKVSIDIPEDRRLTWSECLMSALNKIDAEVILYFQEDYFIQSPINLNAIDEALEIMQSNIDIRYIGLTHFGNTAPFLNCDYVHFKKVRRYSKYRISTQAALWRKEALLSYLRNDENGWMFEIFGTIRSCKRNEIFLTCNRDFYSKESNNLIIDYIHTGIVKGKWHIEIPQLFSKHNINVNYTNRGFYVEKNSFARKKETLKSIIEVPIFKLIRKLLIEK